MGKKEYKTFKLRTFFFIYQFRSHIPALSRRDKGICGHMDYT